MQKEAALPYRLKGESKWIRNALIALLAYVISPVDLAPGPMDDMIMCLLYAIMNYKTISNEVLDQKPES